MIYSFFKDVVPLVSETSKTDCYSLKKMRFLNKIEEEKKIFYNFDVDGEVVRCNYFNGKQCNIGNTATLGNFIIKNFSENFFLSSDEDTLKKINEMTEVELRFFAESIFSQRKNFDFYFPLTTKTFYLSYCNLIRYYAFNQTNFEILRSFCYFLVLHNAKNLCKTSKKEVSISFNDCSVTEKMPILFQIDENKIFGSLDNHTGDFKEFYDKNNREEKVKQYESLSIGSRQFSENKTGRTPTSRTFNGEQSLDFLKFEGFDYIQNHISEYATLLSNDIYWSGFGTFILPQNWSNDSLLRDFLDGMKDCQNTMKEIMEIKKELNSSKKNADEKVKKTQKSKEKKKELENELSLKGKKLLNTFFYHLRGFELNSIKIGILSKEASKDQPVYCISSCFERQKALKILLKFWLDNEDCFTSRKSKASYFREFIKEDDRNKKFKENERLKVFSDYFDDKKIDLDNAIRLYGCFLKGTPLNMLRNKTECFVGMLEYFARLNFYIDYCKENVLFYKTYEETIKKIEEELNSKMSVVKKEIEDYILAQYPELEKDFCVQKISEGFKNILTSQKNRDVKIDGLLMGHLANELAYTMECCDLRNSFDSNPFVRGSDFKQLLKLVNSNYQKLENKAQFNKEIQKRLISAKKKYTVISKLVLKYSEEKIGVKDNFLLHAQMGYNVFISQINKKMENENE